MCVGSKSVLHINPAELIDEERCGVGFRNLGNTCYLNCVLQAFFACPRILESLTEAHSKRTVSTTSRIVSTIGNSIRSLASEYAKIQTGCLNPINLVDLIDNRFTRHTQHDAHECYEYLVNDADLRISSLLSCLS